MFVILNEVKNLIISTESIREILRLSPQNDIAAQGIEGGRVGLRALTFDIHIHQPEEEIN